MGTVHRLFEERAVFEPEVTHAMSIAFEEICQAMNVAPDACGHRKAIAMMIVALARDGAFDPELLRDCVLRQAQRSH